MTRGTGPHIICGKPSNKGNDQESKQFLRTQRTSGRCEDLLEERLKFTCELRFSNGDSLVGSAGAAVKRIGYQPGSPARIQRVGFAKKGGTAGSWPVPWKGAGFMFPNGRHAGPENGSIISGGDEDGVLRNVGFQGERGAFSEVAALRLEPDATLRPCRTLSDVFNLAESGAIHAAVVPVENSLAGSIGDTYDLLLNHGLTVTGEAVISIEHCLLANPGVTLHDIRRVISHPQALAQCQGYLESLGIEILPHYDTAGAAKSVRDSRSECTAAIASEIAAQVYGLEVLARDIQSGRDNFTRFYRIERESRPPGQANKTVLAASLPHYPGSLFMALSSFAARGINLTKIESRPVKRDPWQYIFFLEVEGHASDWQVKSAFDELKAKTSMVRVLGSFAREGS